MKKEWLYALIASLVSNLALMAANYYAFKSSNYLWLSYKSHGGEITIEFAPGFILSHIYGMAVDDKTSHNLHFSIITLVLGVAVGTVIFYLLIKAAGKVLKH